MQVSRQDLITIVERASTMAERLSCDFLPQETKDSESLSDANLEQWCKTVARGNQKLFEKRLAWDGLDLSRVRPILGSVRLAVPDLLPAWTDTLEKALNTTTATNDLKAYRYLDNQHPIPFEDVFLGFIEVARAKLIAQTGASYQLLSDECYSSLERSLLQRLCYVAIQAIAREFFIFRSFQRTPFINLSQQSSKLPAREQYQKFVRGMMEGKLLSFFQDYSVLARLMATLTDFWVDATEEFIRRLASDWSEIQTTFSTQLGRVVRVNSVLSDFHNRGRAAISLTFDTGLKLIYKPKNLGMEKAYFQFLAWLNQQRVPLPFKILKVINRSTYGWVEYVEHLPCSDREQLQRYYQRAGILMCIIYVLQGTDCTEDNLIACGEHPVLVDMETLIYPQFQYTQEQEDSTEAYSLGGRVSNSVLDTGCLPQWQLGSDGESYDISALGQVIERETRVRVSKWQNINTDRMVLGYEKARVQPKANLPCLNGIYLSCKDYVEAIVDGFRQMYCFFLERRETFLASDSLLKIFAHQQVRFLLRNTIVYSLILEKTLNPKFLRKGVERSIQLDFLSRALLSYTSKPNCWLLLKAEQQALDQLDIPYFLTRADSDTLNIYPNRVLEKFFQQPAYMGVIARLNQLSQEDLEQQIGFIKGALGLSLMSDRNHSSLTLSNTAQLNLDEVVSLSPSEMVKQAMAIAAKLQTWAIHFPDGSANWITLGYSTEQARCQFQPMEYDLYNGCSGVVLFLAAIEKVTGNAERDLIRRALVPLRKFLQEVRSSRDFAKTIGIGGATGLGSVIYGLVRSGQFLNEPELWQDAKQAASLLTPEIIFTDRHLDVMNGTAGAILGLLTLYEVTADACFLDLAIVGGHHLLERRVKSEKGYRTWQTLDGKLLTGFSHGAAGIAYTLLRLYKITREVNFLEAAREAIAYEGSVFAPVVGNWPDFRAPKPSFMTKWCHGAPGIGLARLGSLAILDTSEIRQEIGTALTTTQQFGLSEVDHLCCGNFGRIDFFLVAAYQLLRPKLWDEAQKKASLIVSRAEKTNSFQGIYDPSFFRGLAGVGYEMLRLAEPNLLPSVLLWE